MATRHQITCITPHNTTSGRILAVGGTEAGGWTMSEDAAITGLKTGSFTLWTQGGGEVAEVIVVPEGDGHSYLKTLGGGVLSNNLLHLPHCPVIYNSLG